MKTKCILWLAIGVNAFWSCQKQEPFLMNQTNKLDMDFRISDNTGNCLETLNNPDLNISHSPGDVFVEEGMLKFYNHEDFFQTINFLSRGSETEIVSWKEQVGISTCESNYLDFLKASCELEPGTDAYHQLLMEYENKIRFVVLNTSEMECRPYYRTFPYFRNEEGLFMVGQQIEGEFKAKQISVLDGNWNKYYQTIDSLTIDSTYQSQDSTIIITPRWRSFVCCPESNSESVFGENKRLKAEYWWESSKMWNPTTSTFIAVLDLHMNAESDKRGPFGIWVCHRRFWKLNWDVEWTHVPYGATQPIYTETRHGYVAGNDEYSCAVATIRPFVFSRGPIGLFESENQYAFGSCLLKLQQKITIHLETNLPPEKTSILTCSGGQNYSSGYHN